MTRYEYLEVDLWGETGASEEPEFGVGREGYVKGLNAWGAQGWRAAWIDIDTRAHIRVIFERAIEDAPSSPPAAA